jgi:hypothetical protein
MGKGGKDADKLAKCARAANGDPVKLKACTDAFNQGGGGTVQPVAEGGDFFIDADGGKVFITNGGKVFG